MMQRLDAVKWDMLEEWAKTRKAPSMRAGCMTALIRQRCQAVKLATLKHGGRDGTLVVVSRDLARCQTVGEIAPTLQQALDNWDQVVAELELV